MKSNNVYEIMKKISKLKFYKIPLLVIFSFLIGCMFTINITPIDKTCRIEDVDKEYNIMKNSKLNNPELIILILSSIKNLHRRNTIRQTWLNLSENTVKFKMKHYFVIGSLNLNVDDILHLTKEQSEFNDILILPMYDDYKNLTEKVLKSFQWLNEQYDYGLGFKYVLKCDDDSFVHLSNLMTELYQLELKYLKTNIKHLLTTITKVTSPFYRINIQVNNNSEDNEKNSLDLYWGYFNGKAKIKNSGKWKENDWIACDYYIPYALGGGYVISKNLLSYIARNADSFRQFNSEDVSVGFWLSSVRNILRVHDIRFDTEWTTRGCQNFYLITHNISILEMHQFYQSLSQMNRLCSKEIALRNYYLYNWSVLPSHCCNINSI